MIAEGASHVLVCYADDAPPQPYQAYLARERARLPFSISLLLTRPDAADLNCRLARHTGDASEAPETALMRFFIEGSTASVIGVDQPWRLVRSSHAH